MSAPPAYAVAVLSDIDFGDGLIGYLERIDATLVPYGGRFVVHQAGPEVVEGELSGRSAVIVLAFPDGHAAREWYDSPAYREILPLRTDHSTAVVAALVDAVPEGYTAAEGLAAMLAGSRRAAER